MSPQFIEFSFSYFKTLLLYHFSNSNVTLKKSWNVLIVTTKFKEQSHKEKLSVTHIQSVESRAQTAGWFNEIANKLQPLICENSINCINANGFLHTTSINLKLQIVIVLVYLHQMRGCSQRDFGRFDLFCDKMEHITWTNTRISGVDQ